MLSASLLLWADANKQDSPVNQTIGGLWHVIDDDIGKARSRIRFSVDDQGLYSGRVMYLYHSEMKNDIPRCTECKGNKKGKVLVGMTVIEGLKKSGKNKWKGGKITNPDTGVTHKLSVKLIEEGKMLNLSSSFFKAYKGSKMLGESLVWERR